MNSKLIKIGTGAATLATTLYWGVLPALAIDLCPASGGNGGVGYSAPGCAAGFQMDKAIGSIVGILFFIAFMAALVFLIFGGIKWILSSGDKESASKAREAVTNALIGLAITLASYILINIVLRFVLGQDLAKLEIPKLITQ